MCTEGMASSGACTMQVCPSITLQAWRRKATGQTPGCSAPGLTPECSAGSTQGHDTHRSVGLLVAGEAEGGPAATLHIQRLRANVLHTLDGMLAACMQSSAKSAFVQATNSGQQAQVSDAAARRLDQGLTAGAQQHMAASSACCE